MKSLRLNEWDYSTPWWYFITISTKHHIQYLGEIEDEQMVTNTLGETAHNYWKDIPNHFKNVELDEFVIMPNHLHGIIILNQIVPTPDRASPPTLGQIINQYKGSVKRWANKNNYRKFSWQALYYDRIIRDEKELDSIRGYIKENISQWDLDKNHPELREI